MIVRLCADLRCQAALGFSEMLIRAISDHYRCPAALLDFALTGRLSSDEGYFRFGPKVICFGRSCSGSRNAWHGAALYDALNDVVSDHGQVKVPFDPSEIIDNLRLERYADGGRRDSQSLFKKLYYLLRPFMNLTARKLVQRFYSRNWQDSSFPHWPVDTTVEEICERLLIASMEAKGVDNIPFVWFWPRGAPGCVMVTHDVETEAGRDFCDELMDLDDSFGIKASFQVVPEGRYAVSRAYVDSIRSRGFEYGVQDLNHDGRLFDNREEFLRRAEKINQHAAEHGAKGFRAAVLYRRPQWYNRLNFSFDTSIPNVAHLDPQKGGCCTVMPFFIGNVLELPVTTTQDYTLFHLLDERSIDLWKTQLELILEKNGLASFIIHPDYVIDPKVRAVYEMLLDYLRKVRTEKQVWIGLPAEIDSWWRLRSQMSIERVGDSWQIVGEGSERAVLAFARNVGGKLIYDIPNVVHNH
jgi:hypothetical protein